jgi:hypothetical protein
MEFNIERNGKAIKLIPKRIVVGNYEIDAFINTELFDKLLKGYMEEQISYDELEFIASVQNKIAINEFANIILKNNYSDIVPKIKEGISISNTSKILRDSYNSAIIIKNNDNEAIIISKYCQKDYMKNLDLPIYYKNEDFRYIIQDFYGRTNLADLFLQDALSNDYTRISEAFKIIKETSEIKYDTIMDLLNEYFIFGKDIKKKVEQMKKSKKYRSELSESIDKLYAEEVVEVKDGYVIKVNDWRNEQVFLFKPENENEIPKICFAEDSALSKIIRNNKFKQYSGVETPMLFDEFVKREKGYKAFLISQIKEKISIKTPIYDPIISFYSIEP